MSSRRTGSVLALLLVGAWVAVDRQGADHATADEMTRRQAPFVQPGVVPAPISVRPEGVVHDGRHVIGAFDAVWSVDVDEGDPIHDRPVLAFGLCAGVTYPGPEARAWQHASLDGLTPTQKRRLLNAMFGPVKGPIAAAHCLGSRELWRCIDQAMETEAPITHRTLGHWANCPGAFCPAKMLPLPDRLPPGWRGDGAQDWLLAALAAPWEAPATGAPPCYVPGETTELAFVDWP